MFLRRKYLALLALTFSIQQVQADLEIYRINQADVQAARQQLMAEARCSRVARRTVMTVASSAAAILLCNIAWGALKNYKSPQVDFKLQQINLLQQNPAVLTMGELIQVRELLKSAADAKLSQSWGGWLKGQAKAGMASLAIMSMSDVIFSPIFEKIMTIKAIFNEYTFGEVIAKRLAMHEQFQILKQAQLIWDPIVFGAKSVNVEERSLREMAQQYQLNYAKMLLFEREEMQSVGKEDFVNQVNRLMRKMAFVVAAIQFEAQGSNQCEVLNQLAEQLYQSTYELALTIEQFLPVDQTSEIFQAVNMLQATFSNTVRSTAILLSQK